MGKDPIAFRLELLERAKTKLAGEKNDYQPERYARVLELVWKKSNWDKVDSSVHRGESAYFVVIPTHPGFLGTVTYEGKPKMEKVTSAVNGGIVANPDAARNRGEGP